MERDVLERLGFEENEIGVWVYEEEECRVEIIDNVVRIEDYDRMDGVEVIWHRFENRVEVMNYIIRIVEDWKEIENED